MLTYKPEPDKTLDFTVGADIEYVVTDVLKVIDPKKMAVQVPGFGNTGFDGQTGTNLLHEVRPHASYNPLDISRNVRQVFAYQVNKWPKVLDYTYHAGACYCINGQDTGIGAHLHYGLPKDGRELLTNDYLDQITVILDNYVGICSILLEDRAQGLKRRKQIGYGLTGKQQWGHGNNEPWRKQPHGAEYRVCSSFMVSPHVTNGFTCLFKIVLFEFFNNSNFKFRELNFSDDFANMNVTALRNHFPYVWADVQKMKLYPCFKPYVDLIYTLIYKNLGWTPRKLGVKEAWGLIKMRQEQMKKEDTIFRPVSMSSIWGSTSFLEEKIKLVAKPKVLQKEYTEQWDKFYNDIQKKGDSNINEQY